MKASENFITVIFAGFDADRFVELLELGTFETATLRTFANRDINCVKAQHGPGRPTDLSLDCATTTCVPEVARRQAAAYTAGLQHAIGDLHDVGTLEWTEAL